MDAYLKWMSHNPFKPDVFAALQTDYFEQRAVRTTDFDGLPVRVLWADDDRVTPWSDHGKHIVSTIRNADVRLIPGGGHWLHLQKPAECVENSVDMLL